jgi:hypothetical protein
MAIADVIQLVFFIIAWPFMVILAGGIIDSLRRRK